MKINWRDLLERTFWTGIQAFVAVAAATGFDDWKLTLQSAGIAALLAILKNLGGQQIGDSGEGDIAP